ncbi:prolyl hydroxylase family protein [Croceibacterium xixiisoli]
MMNAASLVPDQSLLAKQGKAVRERLNAVPGIYRVPSLKAELWALGDFFTPQECRKMMRMIDAGAKPSKAFDTPYSSGYRTSYSGDVDPFDPFIIRLQRRIDDLLGIDPSYGETMQGQRYLQGQEFKPHTDWFPYGTPYWEQEKTRGQRSITAMIYLNEVEGGGHTDFPELGLSFEPKPGVLLIWNNADMQGVPNQATLHTGSPVTAGRKYVVTKWYRVKPWY